jgi:hypothetical protein
MNPDSALIPFHKYYHFDPVSLQILPRHVGAFPDLPDKEKNCLNLFCGTTNILQQAGALVSGFIGTELLVR